MDNESKPQKPLRLEWLKPWEKPPFWELERGDGPAIRSLLREQNKPRPRTHEEQMLLAELQCYLRYFYSYTRLKPSSYEWQRVRDRIAERIRKLGGVVPSKRVRPPAEVSNYVPSYEGQRVRVCGADGEGNRQVMHYTPLDEW